MAAQNKSVTLSVDLNNFIYGVSRRNFQNAPDLTKIGISLLKTFPAARDAVLEYFAMVFHDAVNVHINQLDYETDPSATGSMESVSMIGPELCSLGEAWAPFIAPWCIKLIMDIATEKANLPTSVLQNTEPVRVLLDITTQNLTLLNAEERAKCIDMMLECRACSWAVGWVGRAEPALVAPRALALGADAARAVLAHLAAHPPALRHVRAALVDLFHEAIREDSKSDKKREVIPYLLNLASKSDIVLKALIQDIENTLTDEVVDRLCVICAQQRCSGPWEGVGPGTLVPLLIRADVHCLLLLLKYAQRNLFCRQLLEYLHQKLELEWSTEQPPPLLASCAEQTPLLRARLLDGARLEQYCVARLLIIVCYNQPSELVSTVSYVLQYSRCDTTLALLVRIISGTLTMHVPADSQDMSLDTERYQGYVSTGVEYGLRDAMIADTQIKQCFIDGRVPPDQKTYLHHFCLNIITLLRWENTSRVAHLRARTLGRAAERNAGALGAALRERASLLRARPDAAMATLPEMPTCHALAEVLDRIDLTGSVALPPSVEAIIKIIQAMVMYFFRCLHEEDIMVKILGVQTACRVIRKLCAHSKLARAVALRALLETAMFREERLFGSRPAPRAARSEPARHLLLHLNQKHGPITQLTQSHTSVFHAGIIGKGVRGPGAEPDGVPPILTTNNELLMGALMACMISFRGCTGSSTRRLHMGCLEPNRRLRACTRGLPGVHLSDIEGGISGNWQPQISATKQDGNSGVVEGATSISLLLVELVSPDVMYNGLPWPDEDFTKQVSIERELYMRGAIERCAPARAALRRVARARPALCLASALLRATAATLLHRLRAHLDRQSQSWEVSREVAALGELLASMALGQLLPHPLSHMLELAPHLTASETVQVLRDCVWNYTRDHVPSPALFTCDASGLHWRDPSTCKPPSTYTDTLRIIIQKRIAKLGHLYPIMFLNLETDNN